MPICSHKKGPYKCSELGMQDIRRANQTFYAKPDRQIQNEYMLKFVTVETPHRRRHSHGLTEKQVTIKYFLNKKTWSGHEGAGV